MNRKPARCCRICDTKVNGVTAAGAPWLIQCCECGHTICPFHVKFRKVKGVAGNTVYKVTCFPKCVLRKKKKEVDLRVKTGVNEWNYFHPDFWDAPVDQSIVPEDETF